MRINFLRNAGLFGSFLDDLTDAVGGERAASNGKENVGGGFACLYEFWSFAGQVVSEGLQGTTANGNESGFVAFAGDSENGVIFIEVL